MLSVRQTGENFPLGGLYFNLAKDFEPNNQFWQPTAYIFNNSDIAAKLTAAGIGYEAMCAPDNLVVRGEAEIAKLIKSGAYVEGYSKSAEEIVAMRERLKHAITGSTRDGQGSLTEEGREQLERDFKALKFLNLYKIEGNFSDSLRAR